MPAATVSAKSATAAAAGTTATAARTTTVVPPIEPAAAAVPEARRSVRAVLREDFFALAGSLVAAVASTSVVFVWLAPFDNPVGFVICAYASFLLLYRLTLR